MASHSNGLWLRIVKPGFPWLDFSADFYWNLHFDEPAFINVSVLWQLTAVLPRFR